MVSSRGKWLVLFVIITGMSMDLLDMTIVNVAIPNLMAVFNVDVNQVQWVATAYMMTLGIIIPITDYLATTLGMKRVFLASTALFTAGSALCGLAWNLNSLVLFRVVQAVGGGMIMPLGISILYKTFTQEERGLAMGLMGLPLLAAPALGPVLGGYLVEHANWRLIFLINVPVGIWTILLTYVVLEEFEKHQEQLDFWGFFFSATGLGGLLLALSNGPTDGWDTPYIVYLLVISHFMLLLFVIWELGHPRPLLELRLFTNLAYCLAMILSVFSIMAIVGCLFLLPVFLQDLQGYGPMKTGLLMLPEALAAAAVLPISGMLVNRVKPALLIIPGMIVLTWAIHCLTKLELQTSNSTLTLILAMLGIGMGLGTMPAITTGLNAVPSHLTGQASSLLNMLRQTASALGVAILASVLESRQDIQYSRIAEGVSITSPGANYFLSQLAAQLPFVGTNGTDVHTTALAVLHLQVLRQAGVLAFQDAFAVAALFAALSILPAVGFLFVKGVTANQSGGFYMH